MPRRREGRVRRARFGFDASEADNLVNPPNLSTLKVKTRGVCPVPLLDAPHARDRSPTAFRVSSGPHATATTCSCSTPTCRTMGGSASTAND